MKKRMTNYLTKLLPSRKFHRRAQLYVSCASVVLITTFFSCSSAPKRPVEVFTNRNAAIAQLDLGNTARNQGDYANAHIFLSEAWRLAVSTDDPETRIQILLAQGNTFFNEGKREQAQNTWALAQKEASDINNASLLSISKIYQARGRLTEGSPSYVHNDNSKQIAQEVKAITQTEMSKLKNPLFLAFAWRTLGLAEKELENKKEAEKALMEAVAIHEKNRYLEDTAYDWYLIASVRSKANDFEEAKAAIAKALDFDRRAENTNGLGMDWLALGTIQEKAKDFANAHESYLRAETIFTSGFLTQNAELARTKIKNLGF